MSSNSMPRLLEDLKRDILRYLVHSTREKTPLEKIIYSGILDEMDEEREKIDKALEKLEEEDAISSHMVSFKVYLPATKEGENILKRLTSEEVISTSPYWLMVFSLVIFWIVTPYLNLQLSSSFEGTTLLSAYMYGVRNAIIFSAIVGVVGTYFLQGIVGKLRRMKVLSPELYNRINDVVKYTIMLSIIGAIVFKILEDTYGFQIAYASIIYFFTALTIALAYIQIQIKFLEKK